MIGIYKIENLINHKIYIGQSIDIATRWQQEISASRNPSNRAYNYPLSQDIRNFGIENFDFQILEECEAEYLNIREKYWIDIYDSYHNGYNQNQGGSSLSLSSEKRIEIVNSIKSLLRTTNLLHKEIAEMNSVSINYVQQINTGKLYYDTNDKYPLQQQQKGHATSLGVKPLPKCKQCGVDISYGAEYCINCYNKNRQTVIRPARDEFKQMIRKNSFVQIGKQFGVSDNAIRNWCDAYNLPRTKKEIQKFNDIDWENL